MSPKRKLTPQEEARLAQVKESFQKRKEITSGVASIKNKIGVYSGKGGVGKTTVAVNLACSLSQLGNSVGIFDVDIDCPNVANIIHLTEGPTQDDKDGKFHPSSRFDVKVMSMSFFHENEEEATIWRGPMITNAINQLLQMTNWGELDYLIVDLPPGTSDGPLTVMQTLNLEGFVIVTAPQTVAKLDAIRSVNMIKKLNQKVIGVVENFSGPVFGTGAGIEISEQFDVPLLGSVSLNGEHNQGTKPASLTSKTVKDEFLKISTGVIDSLGKS
ncbi:P-loop NTPase [Dehalococcoidia bacterium]|nr:P-loop NTPase [Dehalococcoidia bacterium]